MFNFSPCRHSEHINSAAYSVTGLITVYRHSFFAALLSLILRYDSLTSTIRTTASLNSIIDFNISQSFTTFCSTQILKLSILSNINLPFHFPYCLVSSNFHIFLSLFLRALHTILLNKYNNIKWKASARLIKMTELKEKGNWNSLGRTFSTSMLTTTRTHVV